MKKFQIQLLVMVSALALGSSVLARGNFTAHLNDDENVPAFASPTDAQGQFNAHRSGNDSLRYTLNVTNLPNVVASHIHCGPAGDAGPVGVTLFVGGPVSTNGMLAHGEILAPDFVNGCGWDTLDDVIDALESGDTYINIHTLQSFPGEIRGQVN